MFFRALTDAFKWSAKWYFGSFSTAIATFFFFEKYLEFDLSHSIKYGLGVFVLSFIFKAIIQYIKLIDELEQKITQRDEKIEILNTKKEKKKQLTSTNFYGEAIIILKDVFSKFHFLRKIEVVENKDLMVALIFLCNNIKELFEKRFKNNYSVSIKVLANNVDLNNVTAYAELVTLCRDESSYKRRSQPQGIVHNIFENTCFTEIFHNIDDPNKSHYINNDLPEDKYYKNTSFNIYGALPENTNTDERRKSWTLPYRSELVVPITPIEPNNIDRKKQFLGYLCVDCNEEDAFHSKYDVSLLKGVADGIFDIIMKDKDVNSNI
jgi:hypothetical protein